VWVLGRVAPDTALGREPVLVEVDWRGLILACGGGCLGRCLGGTGRGGAEFEL
jgi:hypothetical protein